MSDLQHLCEVQSVELRHIQGEVLEQVVELAGWRLGTTHHRLLVLLGDSLQHNQLLLLDAKFLVFAHPAQEHTTSFGAQPHLLEGGACQDVGHTSLSLEKYTFLLDFSGSRP